MAGTREPVEAAGPAPPEPIAPSLDPETPAPPSERTDAPAGGRHRRRSPAEGAASSLRELVPLVVAALALAIVIKSFLVQAFFIPSVSMEPTLLPGDRILVCRVCTVFDDVAHGDVIVFVDPNPGPRADRGIVGAFLHWLGEGIGVARPERDDFIKRVAALPGDTWEIANGRLLVNGAEVDEPYLGEEPDTRDFGPEVVPDGMLFVLGDNRAHSGDSRFPPPAGLGYVPEEDVIGEAFVIAWPPDRIGGIG
ncbi:MAG TPA: signal peptidase I [Actinomycetota bacterium]|nr:signal peptidase I [Actinomycetota bacterium]